LSGEISWSELQDDVGGLASGVIWNATISVDLVWDD